MKFECKICGETWDDFYDCRSHVFNSHDPEEHCGLNESVPDLFIRER